MLVFTPLDALVVCVHAQALNFHPPAPQQWLPLANHAAPPALGPAGEFQTQSERITPSEVSRISHKRVRKRS